MVEHQRCLNAVHERWLEFGAALLIFLVGLLSFFTFQALDEAEQGRTKLYDYQVVGCERGNQLRAFLTVDAGRNARQPLKRQQSALSLFALADCSDPGKLVVLPPLERNRYLDKTAKQMGITTGWRAPR